MQSINVNITDEQKEFLNTTNNYSEFIRDAIEEKMGRKERSLVEIALDINTKSKEIEALSIQYDSLLNKVLSNKEQLKLSEIQEFEGKVEKKQLENNDFLSKWTNTLSQYPDVLNITDEQINDTSFIMSLVEKIRKDGNRIGIYDLRKYFSLTHVNPVNPKVE